MSTLSKLTKILDWSKPSRKFIYNFNEGSSNDTRLLGYKGAQLCDMHRLGLPVPDGWILTTEACGDVVGSGVCKLGDNLQSEMREALQVLESSTGRSFCITGENEQDRIPLLLSVRAGASTKMLGMVPTILHIGMNDQIAEKLARFSNNPTWAMDTHRRFLRTFGEIILGVESTIYEEIVTGLKTSRRISSDREFNLKDLQFLVQEFKKVMYIPDDPWVQLTMAIESVYLSWQSPEAVRFRDLHNIPKDTGVAVVVQSMVFGNMNECSGTGVALSRNPLSGEIGVYGEYLPTADGSDLSTGEFSSLQVAELKTQQPSVYDAIERALRVLESHYHDMQELEFTVENSVLYALQSKKGQRSPIASLRIAVDMVNEKLISEREALLRIPCEQLRCCLYPMISSEYFDLASPDAESNVLCRGLPLYPGVITGQLAFDATEADDMVRRGIPTILCAHLTLESSFTNLNQPMGLLLSNTSTYTDLPRMLQDLQKPTLRCANTIYFDPIKKQLCSRDGRIQLSTGDTITMDGSTGLALLGQASSINPAHNEEFKTIMKWAEKYKRLQVLASADSVEQVRQAIDAGAEGIGLFYTENLFGLPDRIGLFRTAMLTDKTDLRESSLRQLQVMQQQDFEDIFRAAENHEIVIRLLSSPLHSFLPRLSDPRYDSQIEDLARSVSCTVSECRQRIANLLEYNPMLGCRGCRIAVSQNDIFETQVRAITRAYLQVHNEGIRVSPKMLIPMVFGDHEVEYIASRISHIAKEEAKQAGHSLADTDAGCNLGAIIEVPRACLRADRIATAQHVTTLCFDTDELTEKVFGMSSADAKHYLPSYFEKRLLARNPFRTIDANGVGALVQLGVTKLRTITGIFTGVSGTHTTDPASVDFFNSIGMDFLCCTPMEVPTAMLASAQSRIRQLSYQHPTGAGDIWETARALMAQF